MKELKDCENQQIQSIEIQALQQTISNLQQQLDFYKTLVDTSCDFECLISHDGKYVYVSPSCFNITGYHQQDFFENPQLLEEITLAEDKFHFYQHIHHVYMENAKLSSFSFRIATKQGEIKWLEHHCSKTYNNHQLIGYRITNKDITDRKTKEEALEQTNRVLREFDQMFSQGEVMLIKWKNKANYPIDFVSDNAVGILGYSPEEINSEGFKYSSLIHPTDRLRVLAEFAQCAQMTDKKFQHKPYRLLHKKGHTVWVSDFKSVYRNKKKQIEYYYGYLVDITELLYVQQKLEFQNEKLTKAKILIEERDKQFEQLLANMEQGFALHKIIYNNKKQPIDYTFEMMNPAFEKMTGISAQKAIGNTVKTIFPDIEEFWIKEYGIVAKSGISLQITRHSGETGKQFDILAYSPKKDYFATVISPINTDEKTENELVSVKIKSNQKEELFQIVLEESIIWEVLYDTSGRIILSSKAFEGLTGFSNSDYLNEKISIMDFCHPDDKTSLKNNISRIIKGENQLTHIFKIVTKSKEIKYLSADAKQVYKRNGERFGFKVSYSDITRLMNSELKATIMQMAVEQSPVSIVITDANGNIEYVNHHFSEVTGYQMEEVKGKNPRILKSGQTEPEAYRQLWESLSLSKKWQGEFCNRKKNGELFYEKAIISAITDQNEKIIYYVGIKEDITQKKMEDKLFLQAIVETEEKERTRIAQELHDGVGPLLSSAKMFIQFINKPNAKLNTMEITNSVEEMLNEATRTIRQISYSLSPHILHNFGLVDAIISFAKKIEATGKIKIKISSNGSQKMNSNKETVLYRALCECINNTIKHANASNVEIIFTFGENSLQISYLDDGHGFDIDNAIGDRTGIGLFNMKNRVEIMNGSLEIVSSPGSGTGLLFKINQIA